MRLTNNRNEKKINKLKKNEKLSVAIGDVATGGLVSKDFTVVAVGTGSTPDPAGLGVAAQRLVRTVGNLHFFLFLLHRLGWTIFGVVEIKSGNSKEQS